TATAGAVGAASITGALDGASRAEAAAATTPGGGAASELDPALRHAPTVPAATRATTALVTTLPFVSNAATPCAGGADGAAGARPSPGGKRGSKDALSCARSAALGSSSSVERSSVRRSSSEPERSSKRRGGVVG